ncbi:MAG TPA: flavodoxin family protein [Methanocorpusculum sp.]|nr:flavodoxin family protein [Methanocorpusculum sp.]
MTDVILLSGSPRANGNTELALTVCKEAIEAAGLTAKIISLRGKEIKGCIACGKCAGTGCCSLKDDLNTFLPEIREAKGFIVGAPVYFGTARGDVMNFMQRMCMVARANGNWLSGKVGGPVVVARRGGLTSTLQEMLMAFFISGMTVCGSTYWNIVFGQKPGEAAGDAEGIDTLKTFGKNVAELIKKIE